MRLILLILSFFVALSVFSQVTVGSQYYQILRRSDKIDRILHDSVLGLPKKPAVKGIDTGAIYYRLTDSSILVWTGSQWRATGAAAVDSIWRVIGKDSIFFRKNGTTFAIKDSTGSSLPSQTGNNGKYLTTNGTSASWGTPPNFANTNLTLTGNRTHNAAGNDLTFTNLSYWDNFSTERFYFEGSDGTSTGTINTGKTFVGLSRTTTGGKNSYIAINQNGGNEFQIGAYRTGANSNFYVFPDSISYNKPIHYSFTDTTGWNDRTLITKGYLNQRLSTGSGSLNLQQVVTNGNTFKGSINLLDDFNNVIGTFYDGGGFGGMDFGIGSNFVSVYGEDSGYIYFNRQGLGNLMLKPTGLTGNRTVLLPNASGTLPLSIRLNGTTYTANDTGSIELGTIGGIPSDTSTSINNRILAKQDLLVSGTNIKTINGNSLLGSGDLTISGGSSDTASFLKTGSVTEIGTIFIDTFPGTTISSTKWSNIVGTANNRFIGPSGVANWFTYLEFNRLFLHEKLDMVFDFKAVTKNSGDAWGIWQSTTGLTFATSIYLKVDLSNGVNSGKVSIGTTTAANEYGFAYPVSFNAGDSMRLTIRKTPFKTITILENLTTPSNTAGYGEFDLKSWGTELNYRIAFLGGNQEFTKVQVFSRAKNFGGTGGVVFVGDSHTKGVGVTSVDRRWTDLLMRSQQHLFENLGVPSWVSGTMASGTRLSDALAAIDGKYLIINYGWNDAFQGLGTATLETNLTTIATTAQGLGYTPIFISLIPALSTNNTSYNTAVSNAATATGSTFIDVRTPLYATGSTTLLNPLYTDDGVHLNYDGNYIFDTAVANRLKEYFNDIITDLDKKDVVSYNLPMGKTNEDLVSIDQYGVFHRSPRLTPKVFGLTGNNFSGGPKTGTNSSYTGEYNTLLLANNSNITSGKGNIGIGRYALNGIQTGNNNIHMSIGNGVGPGAFSTSLSSTVLIGDPVKLNNKPIVAGDIVLTTPYLTSTQFWFGGKSDNPSDVVFNIPSRIGYGSNLTGFNWDFRSGLGTGSGEAGSFLFKHSTPVASGTTEHSAFTTTLQIDRQKITVGSARFQTKTGANVASAGDLTLGNDGNVFTITGTTTINAITTTNWQAGSEIILIFSDNVTVKNNTSGGANTAVMKLLGGVDFSATADDVLTLIYTGSSWVEKSRSVN
jgi:lysophospholipase L1-like esterase